MLLIRRTNISYGTFPTGQGYFYVCKWESAPFANLLVHPRRPRMLKNHEKILKAFTIDSVCVDCRLLFRGRDGAWLCCIIQWQRFIRLEAPPRGWAQFVVSRAGRCSQEYRRKGKSRDGPAYREEVLELHSALRIHDAG